MNKVDFLRRTLVLAEEGNLVSSDRVELLIFDLLASRSRWGPTNFTAELRGLRFSLAMRILDWEEKDLAAGYPPVIPGDVEALLSSYRTARQWHSATKFDLVLAKATKDLAWDSLLAVFGFVCQILPRMHGISIAAGRFWRTIRKTNSTAHGTVGSKN